MRESRPSFESHALAVSRAPLLQSADASPCRDEASPGSGPPTSLPPGSGLPTSLPLPATPFGLNHPAPDGAWRCTPGRLVARDAAASSDPVAVRSGKDSLSPYERAALLKEYR